MLIDLTLKLPPCPVCGGTLEVVYNRFRQVVAVCHDCHSGLTIPDHAWRIAHAKAVSGLKQEKIG